MKGILKQIGLIFLILAAGLSTVFSQSSGDRDVLPPSFHKERRELLRDKLPPRSVALFFSNAVRNRSGDLDYVYHQDPDFYYLTGYPEPNAVLLLFKSDQQNQEGKKYNEILFVQPRNEWDELWHGARLGIEGVKDQLGFDMVYANSDFQYYNPGFRNFNHILFKPIINDIRDTEISGDLYDLVNWFREKAGIGAMDSLNAKKQGKNRLDNTSLDGMMNDLRGIKTPGEIGLLKTAIRITCAGQVEAMKAARPGISEREIQGIQEFVHRAFGSADEGYPPIVGSGNNSCVLHYEENSRPAIDSTDLVLMDVGAEYGGYSADVTRTIPVSGKFTVEQRQIYDLVNRVRQASIDLCRQGISFDKFEKTAHDLIADGLMNLGIIKSYNESYTYLPHGVSHHIGLDVHDRGNYHNLEENMVITIEPGIYIPEGSPCDKKWWKTGVRIEDDLLVQKDGCEVLSTSAPVAADEIESLMTQPGILDIYPLKDPR